MPEVAIIVTAKDKASATLKKVGGSLGKLGKVAAIAGAAGVAALAGIAIGATKLALDAAKLEPTKVTFDSLTKSIGSTADAMLKKLRPATMGIVSDADLMQAANKLMAMGLAETEEEAAKLSEMAVTLGMAMGEDATNSMENFALMMANQSIPRLDSFGISSGKVRERINELMESTEGMTREMAFNQAVMEQGAIAMDKVGDISGTSAVTMGQMSATIANLKMTIGEALLPVLKRFLDFLQPLIQYIVEVVLHGDAMNDWLTHLPEPLQPVVKFIGDLIEGIKALIPKLGEIAEEVGPKVAVVFGEIGDFISENVVPAIKELWKWINEDLVPLFKKFVEEFGPDLVDAFGEVVKAAEALGSAVTIVLSPALKTAWDKTEGLRKALVDLAETKALTFLVAAFERISQLLADIAQAMVDVTRRIRGMVSALQAGGSAWAALGNLIPSWLIPGSTSPFEKSIRGITDAFRDMNAGMGMQAMTPAPAATGDVHIHTNLGGVYGVDGIERAMEDVIRDAARYSL